MRVPCSLLLVAAAVVACHHGTPIRNNPTAEVAVTVDNQNFADMDVFLIRSSGQRIRLGMVPGLSQAILMLPPEYVTIGADLQFEVHPIGSRANSISERVSARPGDVIQLVIPPH